MRYDNYNSCETCRYCIFFTDSEGMQHEICSHCKGERFMEEIKEPDTICEQYGRYEFYMTF